MAQKKAAGRKRPAKNAEEKTDQALEEERQTQEQPPEPSAEQSAPTEQQTQEQPQEPSAEQSAPTEQQSQDESAEQGESTEEDRDPGPYVPRHRPLQNAGFDDKAAEEKRQAELAEERRVGLLRTAGQPVD